MSGSRRIRRIVLATLKGTGIGFLVGAVVGAVAGWIVVVVTHWGPPPPRPPIEDLSGLLPAILGAIVFGFVWAVRASIAMEPPEKAARHRVLISRFLMFMVPLALALVVGHYGSFAVHETIERSRYDPYSLRTDWDRQLPGLAATGVFLIAAILGLIVAIIGARHAPQPGAVSRLLSRLGLRLESMPDP